MKIKGISMLIALAFVAFGLTVSVASAEEIVVEIEAAVVVTSENTAQLCSDGVDNNDNGSTDLADPSCAAFVVQEVAEVVIVAETTAELCSDGIDNNDNGATDLADTDCAAFVQVEVVIVPENTALLCADGLDNNDNGAIDLADVDCAPFVVVEDGGNNGGTNPENTAGLCSDGIDNNDNGAIDLADTDCAAFVTPEDNGGNNGGSDNDNDDDDDDDNNSSSRGSSGQKKSSNRPTPQGEVLGAFTGSCPFLTTYMRIGWANDVAEVTKLQEFLNAELSISLPTTGFFGQLTHDAVNAFQLKYKDEVLQPWVDAGLHESKDVPTGYVYLTTQYMINKIVCPDEDIAEPVLPKTL